ncbi:MAG: TonB family protein [Oligoflexia bacterium]|nr:TonB family protein [Oligoflexia bacterium]MBF0366632.1 TonB family protein [Oligoflexia bacterium]
MNNTRKIKLKTLPKALLFSFLFHLLLLLLISSFYKDIMTLISSKGTLFAVNNVPKEKKYIKLSFADKDYKKTPKTPLLERIQENKVRQQIVNNENTGANTPPINSRFLGEKNQSFEKQTTAHDIGIFKKAGIGEQVGRYDQKIKQVEEKKVATAKNQPKAQNKLLPLKTPTDLSLSDLSVAKNKEYLNEIKNQLFHKKTPKDDTLTAKNDTPPEEATKNIEDEDLKALGIRKGDALAQGLSRNNDFLEDVPLGDVTNLNTKEFKFYGFYARIRERLEQYWGYTLKQKVDQIYRAGSKLAPGKNYITSLKIIIDAKGNIVQIAIIGPSGLKNLDDAAIESFYKAGPFPNPPKEMVQQGPVTLEWGFVVKS